MTETDAPIVSPEPRKRVSGAAVLFLLVAAPMPVCMLLYHFMAWQLEQAAIATSSLAMLAWAGPVGLAIQGITMTGMTIILWWASRDIRFKPVYAGWLIAALMAFPALLLRWLGPHNDQLGSILQISICAIAALIVMRVRGIKIDRKSGNLPLAWFAAALGIAPFAAFGAFGSPTDAILGLLAGLAFGWLAALLMESTTGNRLLDAFGSGATLALLGSAIGYDGAQLILLGILPFLMFAIAAVMPERASAAILTGLLTAASFIFFDPTELTIILGDIGEVAQKAVGLALSLVLSLGLIVLMVQSLLRKEERLSVRQMIVWVGAVTGGAILVIPLVLLLVAALLVPLGAISGAPIAFRGFLDVALGASGLAVGAGVVVAAIALLLRWIAGVDQASNRMRLLSWAGAAAAWIIVLVLFVTNGSHGFYGDRLFVILKEQADLSGLRQIEDIDERRTAAYAMLTEHANETQAPLRDTLDRFGVEYTPYYLVDAIEVRGGTLLRLYLSARPEVDRVIPSPRLRPAPAAAPPAPNERPSSSPGVQWNVSMIGADRVWEEFNVRGEGIVVGQSDSGADGKHPDLKDSYRGKTAGDDYNWFDPWNGKPSPYDDGGHGTHTLGTIVGQNGIGIAPGATWFGCANLNRNLGNPALYLDCLQFMLAPFPQNGDPFSDGDPARAADVLNNSWGCPEIEGCDPNALLYAADHLRDAGIFVVASAGNDGPNCSTVNAPLPLYDSVFSVGAINRQGNMAEFSSRGPVTADGSGRMKPDIVAPGVGVLSALPGGGYGLNSGTSMAGPHVAGAVALLWSADPSLIGDIDRTEELLIQTADPYTGTLSGCFEGEIPNAAYGYGILDVYEAVKQALGQ